MAQKLSISALAKRLNTGRFAVQRALDPDNISISLNTISRVAHVLGLKISLKPRHFTPDEFDALVSKMINAAAGKESEEAEAYKKQIMEGFYGEPYDEPTKRLAIFIQPGGSAGKTTVAAGFVEWCLQLQPRPKLAVFDADERQSTLFRIFDPNGSTPLPAPHSIQKIDSRSDSGKNAFDAAMNALAGDKGIAILDGVANQSGDVPSWLNDGKLYSEAKRLGIGIVFIVPVDESTKTSESATRIIVGVGGRADILIVRNLKRLTTLPWDAVFRDVIFEGGQIPPIYQIALSKWDVGTVKYLQGEATGKPLSLFATSTLKSVDVFTRSRAEPYWESFAAQMENVRNVLLPVGFSSAVSIPPPWVSKEERKAILRNAKSTRSNA